MKIALRGASGFIGTVLQKEFRDYVVIKRDDSEEEILKKLDGVDAVINLAGAPILKRWSKSYKEILYKSRIETTKKLVNAINKSSVKHFISSSAIAIYPNNMACDENCPKSADDFLAKLVKDWEREAMRCEKATAILRLGVVLGVNGGALKKMLLPFRLALGGKIGNGSMVMSWIDIEDLVKVYHFILENRLQGIYNGVAPNPISNADFTKELASILNRPAILPLPKPLLKLIYGEAVTVLTASKEVYPKALLEAGFQFRYPTIKESLEHLLKR